MLCYFSRHMFSKVRSVILQTLSKVSALSHSLENVMGHSLCRVFILKARGSSASVTTMWSSKVHNDSIGCWLLRKSARWKLVRSAMTRSRIHATMNQLLWSFSEAQRRSTCTGKRHLYIDAKETCTGTTCSCIHATVHHFLWNAGSLLIPCRERRRKKRTRSCICKVSSKQTLYETTVMCFGSVSGRGYCSLLEM